jgi:hypothetical protein
MAPILERRTASRSASLARSPVGAYGIQMRSDLISSLVAPGIWRA